MPGRTMPEAPLLSANAALPVPLPGGMGGFAPVLRRALRQPTGRVVLRVEDPAPHRRRVARGLLQDGALAAGGQVVEGPGGDLLLVGAEAHRAEGLRGLLDRLLGPAGTLVWSLEHDAEALLAYAAGQAAVIPRPVAEGPALAGLDEFLDAQPLGRLVRRRQGYAVTVDGLRPAFLRLAPDEAALTEQLGLLARDADLMEHARQRIAQRVPRALTGPEGRALIGPAVPPALHLPLALAPARGAGPGLPRGRVVASLPLAAAAAPAALAARRASLAEAGIGLELDGLDAEALSILDAGCLPADLLRVTWSPALATGAPLAALRRLDPARLVLAGYRPEAAELVLALGLRLVEPA